MVYSSSIFYFDQCYRLTKKKISNFINKIYWNAGPAISESKLQVNFPRPFILTAVKRNRTAVNVNGVHLQAVFGGRERARARKVKKKNRDCFTPGRFECVRMCVWLSFWLLFFFLIPYLCYLSDMHFWEGLMILFSRDVEAPAGGIDHALSWKHIHTLRVFYILSNERKNDAELFL